MKYVFEYPDVLDKMPKGAVLVILPEDDKELHDENYKVSEENKITCVYSNNEDAKTADIEY